MDDQTVIETVPGERPDLGLFAPAPGEGERENAYAMRSTGPVALKLDDAEFDLDFAGADDSKGWRMRAAGALVLTGLTVALGIAAGYPGPASGLVPLPMSVIPFAATAGAVACAVAAFFAWMSAVRRAAGASPARRARLSGRALFLGSGLYKIQIGEAGLAVASEKRRLTLNWTMFDTEGVLKTLGRQKPPFPLIGRADAEGLSLHDVFSARDDNAALDRLLEEASVWADGAEFIALPLEWDRDFYAPRKGEKPVARSDAPEFLRLPRAAFSAGGDLPWPLFVAAASLMIAKANPAWPHRLGAD